MGGVSAISEVTPTRRFINPTPGWVGAVKLNARNEPEGHPVEPGGSILLTELEERLTAEAPRLPQDNPFVKQWEEIIEFDTNGEPKVKVTREGTLQLDTSEARPIASERYIPSVAERQEAPAPVAEVAAPAAPLNIEVPEGFQAVVEDGTVRVIPLAELDEEQQAAEEEPAEEITGAPPIERQPPVEGQPSPGEVVGSPEAPERNDEHVAAQRAAAEAEEKAEDPEAPTPVGEAGPQGVEAIGSRQEPALI